MPEAFLRARLQKVGDGYGIAIDQGELDRLGLKEGAELTLRVSSDEVEPDLSMFPVFADGPDVSENHDRYLREGLTRQTRR